MYTKMAESSVEPKRNRFNIRFKICEIFREDGFMVFRITTKDHQHRPCCCCRIAEQKTTTVVDKKNVEQNKKK